MWVRVDNHWLNMAQALVVDVDDTSVPPAVSIVFPGDVKRTLAGVDRQEVIEYLERASRAQGESVYGKAPFLSYDSRSA